MYKNSLIHIRAMASNYFLRSEGFDSYGGDDKISVFWSAALYSVVDVLPLSSR
jgi:hypothetical protein